MSVTRADIRSAYRYLLRSISIAFREDHVTLAAAKIEAHRRFSEGEKTLNADPAAASQAIKEARDIGKFLRENLVQGIKDERTGNYRINLLSIWIDG